MVGTRSPRTRRRDLELPAAEVTQRIIGRAIVVCPRTEDARGLHLEGDAPEVLFEPSGSSLGGVSIAVRRQQPDGDGGPGRDCEQVVNPGVHGEVREAAHIDQHDGERARGALRACKRVIDAIREQQAAGEAGARVDQVGTSEPGPCRDAPMSGRVSKPPSPCGMDRTSVVVDAP
jgi:hypothetical protein